MIKSTRYILDLMCRHAVVMIWRNKADCSTGFQERNSALLKLSGDAAVDDRAGRSLRREGLVFRDRGAERTLDPDAVGGKDESSATGLEHAGEFQVMETLILLLRWLI